MRIAILVYGRLNKCVEHYNNIIKSVGDNHDIDFFLSSDNSSETLLNDFISLYKPILYTNNPIYYNYDLSKYPVNPNYNINFHNMTCHFINKNRVIALLETYVNKTNIQYEAVVSLRIDCVFKCPLVIGDLKDNTIYIPHGYDYVENGINDQIAMGKLDVMKKYNYINPIYLLDNKLSIPHPESLTYANILFNKLNIKRVSCQYYLDR